MAHKIQSYFAERRPLCRAPWKRHSAKTALCVCWVLTSLLSAVEEALGKDGHLPSATSDARQRSLCRVPNTDDWQRVSLPSAAYSSKARARQSSSPPNAGARRLLYREPSVWHSAKAGSLPSASWPGSQQSLLCWVFVVALGKEFFFCLLSWVFLCFVSLFETLFQSLRLFWLFCYI